jgi:hypothetical protein
LAKRRSPSAIRCRVGLKPTLRSLVSIAISASSAIQGLRIPDFYYSSLSHITFALIAFNSFDGVGRCSKAGKIGLLPHLPLVAALAFLYATTT